MQVSNRFAKLALWFLLELSGSWVIWATYMAVKFMTEVAQGQRASFSAVGPGSVGAVVIIPALATAFWTVGAVIIAADAKVKE